MKKWFNRLLSVVLALLIVISGVNASMIISFAENEEADKWDGTTEVVIPEEGVYKITSAKQLAWFASVVNGGNTFKDKTVSLEKDIDLDNRQWNPIGRNLTCAFSGVFKGNGHTINNMMISVSIDAANIINAPFHTVGFFGVCVNAEIVKLHFNNTNISISNSSGYSNASSSINGTNIYAGEICGYSQGTKIIAVYSEDGSVSAYTGAEAGEAVCGGFVGCMADNSETAYCFKYSGSVSGTSQSASQDAVAGGVVGKILNEGTVRQCCNYGSVNGGHSICNAYTGGVVGYSSGNSDTLSVIKDCFNRGNVVHSGSWLETGALGGIAGYSGSSINRCYNSGTVYASTNTVGGDLFEGGIAGNAISSAPVSNCAVFSQQISGGTKRYIICSSGSKSNNFGLSSISGSPINDTTALHSLDYFTLLSFYQSDLGFDFSSIWEEGSDGYPILKEYTLDVEQDIAIVNDAIRHLVIGFAEGDNYNRVTKDVILASKIDNLDISWNSSDESVINSITGEVNRKSHNIQIKLTASVSKSDYVSTKRFTLCVLGTEEYENIQSEAWGMNIDDARELIAMVRGCKFKDVAAYDPDVLVLIGQDTNEESIKTTMANIIDFWEVPIDNAYMRTKIGDVIGLIKDGTDEQIDDLIGDFSGGFLSYDPSEQVTNETVAKKLMAVPKEMHTIKEDAGKAYEKAIPLGLVNFNSSDDAVLQVFDHCEKVGNFIDFTINKTSEVTTGDEGNSSLGNVFGYVSDILQGWMLYGAYQDAKKNAVKAYFQNYMGLRGNYSSPSDEEFQLLMAAHTVSSIKTDLDNIESIAEALYYMETKFCAGLDDEYKIVIACPVDIEVYDETGTLVGRVIDNVVDRSIYNSVRISVDGENNDEKTVYIQDKDKYSVKMIGNDTGSMDISIVDSKSKKYELYDYNNISLYDGKSFTMDITINNEQGDSVPVVETMDDGAVYFETETKEADSISKTFSLNVYSCVEKNGEMILSDVAGNVTSGFYSEGTEINGLIHTNFGYSFEGFYSDADCTHPYSGSKMPSNALVLYAKFIKNNNNINITVQPVGASYIADSIAEELSISYETVAGYDVDIKWYCRNLSSGEEQIVQNASGDTCLPSTKEYGRFGYYAEISLVDENGDVFAQARSSVAIISVDESKLLASGACGDQLSWSFYENGKLKISGSGSMNAFASADDVPWKQYKKLVQQVVLTESLTSISAYAFADFKSIKTITIPDSVQSIGEYALNNCESLESLSIPFLGSSRTAKDTFDAVLGFIFGRATDSESGTVQYYLLNGTNLSGFTYKIPASLNTVSVTDADQIPFGSFYNCSGLREIELNTTVSSIAAYAFYGCSSIKSMTIPDSVEQIGERALCNCSDLENLSLPFVGSSRNANNTYDAVLGFVFGRSENGISQYYVLKDNNLSYYKYSIPTSLKTIKITDAQTIPFGAFHNCSFITSIELNDVVLISGFSFANCTGLTDIVVPKSVTRIDEKAFNGCNNLKSMTLPFVGSSRTANGTYDAVLGFVFGRASAGVIQYGVVSGTSLSGYYYDIPNSLKTVVITDASIIPIGAFSNCVDINLIKINEGVTVLSDYSLMNCTGLKEIRLPSTLQSLSYTILYDCSSLTTLYMYSRNCQIDMYNETVPASATVYAYSGSTAQTYSVAIGRSFVPIDVVIQNKIDSSLIVDTSKKIIYGVKPGTNNLMSQIDVFGEGSATISSTGKAVTGITVTLQDVSGLVTDTYSVVVFGDVNGDGWYDGQDSLIVNCFANGLLTREQVCEAKYMAADCNHDGEINEADVALLEQAGLLLANVDQTMSQEELLETDSYMEYLNLIDQNPTANEEISEDPVNEESPEISFLQKLADFFKIFISFIRTFIVK